MIAATLLPTTAWTHNLKVNIIEPVTEFQPKCSAARASYASATPPVSCCCLALNHSKSRAPKNLANALARTRRMPLKTTWNLHPSARELLYKNPHETPTTNAYLKSNTISKVLSTSCIYSLYMFILIYQMSPNVFRSGTSLCCGSIARAWQGSRKHHLNG